ncbi:MAG: hypothetical protein FJ215_08890 [Ignavibacteria bacterium]|nr:hypothetical protein [Ignavibacteria bacterium]
MISLILVYVTAVLVSIVLERQERRHCFNIELEYRLLQKPVPPKRPKLPRLESWLNIAVGVLLLMLGALFLWTLFSVISNHQLTPLKPMERDALMGGAVFVAAGLALIILGAKSLKLNSDYERANR